MTLSVATSNRVSEKILNGITVAGALALAAHWLESPIGAVGGAVFGGVLSLSGATLSLLTSKVLNKDHPEASSATKTLAAVIEFFGSHAAAWGALAAMGLSLTVSHAIHLAFTSLFTSLVVTLVLKCLNLRYLVESSDIFQNGQSSI